MPPYLLFTFELGLHPLRARHRVDEAQGRAVGPARGAPNAPEAPRGRARESVASTGVDADGPMVGAVAAREALTVTSRR